jgi:putative transposase
MARKHHKPEEIVARLRQVEVLRAHGMSAVEAVSTPGAMEQTYYRWRAEHGGLKLDQSRCLRLLEEVRPGSNNLWRQPRPMAGKAPFGAGP